jgi:hypothetical protein
MPENHLRQRLEPAIKLLRDVNLEGDAARTNDKQHYMEALRGVANLLTEVGRIAAQSVLAVENISQPGIIKEMITASVLEHRVNSEKHHHDAVDFVDSGKRFEYLAALEGKTFQLERVTKDKLKNKVLRNEAIFCSVFSKQNTLKLLRVYQIVPDILFNEFVKQVDQSVRQRANREKAGKKAASGDHHVAVDENWAIQNGQLVYDHQKGQRTTR